VTSPVRPGLPWFVIIRASPFGTAAPYKPKLDWRAWHARTVMRITESDILLNMCGLQGQLV